MSPRVESHKGQLMYFSPRIIIANDHWYERCKNCVKTDNYSKLVFPSRTKPPEGFIGIKPFARQPQYQMKIGKKP